MVWMYGGVALLLALCAAVWVWLRRRRRERGILAIVMLRAEPRRLTEAELRGAARRALGAEADVLDLQATPVPGSTPWVVLYGGSPVLYVVDANIPYTPEAERVAGGAEDPRVREALLRHRCWVSVDVPMSMPEMEEGLTLMMARVAAELLDENCLILYTPRTGRFAIRDGETEAKLRSASPMEIFEDRDVNTPIFRVDDGDKKAARVDRAIEKARENYPRLLDAWRRLGPGCEPMVKFRVDDEHLWMSVEAMNAESITGEIQNEPLHPDLKKGQRLTVTVAQLSDWAYMENDKAEGLYVERVLRGG